MFTEFILKFFSLVLSLVLTSSAIAAEEALPSAGSNKIRVAPEAKISPHAKDPDISHLTLQQKVGQLFIFGFSSAQVDQKLSTLLKTLKPGGLIIFGRNVKNPWQVYQLNSGLRKLSLSYAGLTPLIMIDQEGGSVSRIKTHPSSPSALALGMTEDAELIRETGKTVGNMLHLLGFNMNLAPVLDLSSPGQKSFIGNRSFGDNPHKVKLWSQAFSEGLVEAGILPTAKHFPGHGAVTADSHKVLPVKNVSLEILKETDLVPFQHFVSQHNISATMVAHVSYPLIDPTGLPATFSPTLINKILRDQMGYNGVIITDDIEMSGAESVGSVGERAIKAIEAGCDMVMVAWSPQRQTMAVESVLAAVKSGRISEDRIDDSLRRIMRVKAELAEKPTPKYSIVNLEKEFKSITQQLKVVTEKVSFANFKKSSQAHLELRGIFSAEQRISVFASDPQFYKSFVSLGFTNARYVKISPSQKDPIPRWLKKYPQLLPILYVTGEGSARRLRDLSPEIKKQLIVISAVNEGLIGDNDHYRALFNIRSQDYRAGRWVAEFLFKSEVRLPSSANN